MISVAIIVKNAEKTISDCINSVKELSNDIVVVIDDSTSDQTKKIVKQLGCRVFIRHFDHFASQKNYALSKTKFDWVFSLDADELSSPKLNTEIIACIHSSEFKAYKIPRLNVIFGKPIYHTNWGPSDDAHIWLFNKNFCRWEGNVHEEIICNGEVGILKNFKYHNSYQTVEEFISKMNLYTTKETNNHRLYTNPVFDFFRRYFWHKGFLDGWHGLFLSYLMAIYHLTIWVKKSFSSPLSV